MTLSHPLACRTLAQVLLTGVLILRGGAGATAEEALIREVGTRVECFDPNSAHKWSDEQSARAEAQCGQASGGRFVYADGKLTVLNNDNSVLVYSDNRNAYISGNGDKCAWYSIDSFDMRNNFVIVQLSGYENYQFDYINLANGVKKKLWERPNFSPSGQQFIVVRSEQEADMEDEFTIYSIRNGALVPDSGLPRDSKNSYQVWNLQSWQDDGTARLHVEYRLIGDESFRDADVMLQRRPNGVWTLIGWPAK